MIARFLVLVMLPCYAQPSAEADIRQVISRYAASVDAADIKLAAQVWETSPEVTFIHPLGEAHGWTEVQGFLTDVMGAMFTDRKLVSRDIKVHVYDDAAWAEFNWHFAVTHRKDGAAVQTDGR